MSKASSRRTLSTVLEFLGYSSQTMDDSLITHPSESSARSWELGITTPHPPTHKLMDKQKLQTDLLKIIKTQLEQEAKR